MKKRLTEASVKSMSADPKKRIEIYDEVATGLMLRISPSGKKSWSVVYRVAGRAIDGKRGKLQR
ncbi:MAG: integrase arm-type DNA-binding domain-containing protein, partial [Pseudomonadota bacterium]